MYNNSLNQLYEIIKKNLIGNNIDVKNDPVYKDFRDGDVRHSKADITKAKDKLGYLPKYKIAKGIEESLSWYINKLNN